MEEEQLAAQRQTYLGCPIVAQYCCPAREVGVKVRHVDGHIPKSWATEEHQTTSRWIRLLRLKWLRRIWTGNIRVNCLSLSGPMTPQTIRDAAYRWARDQGVGLTMDATAQVANKCETCTAIKKAKWVKPQWYGGQWLKYKYGEAWKIDYITLPQTCQYKCHGLTVVEATVRWLETYPLPHATAQNAILGLEKQVLWRHGTPGRIESDNGTHFCNSLIDTWDKEHGIKWVYHIPYHAPASGKIQRYNRLLKTTPRAMGGGTFKNWYTHLAKAIWLVNTRRCTI